MSDRVAEWVVDTARRDVLDGGILKQLMRLLLSPSPALQAIGALAIGNASIGGTP